MRFGIVLVALAAALGAAALSLKAPQSRVQATYEQERGYFYRLTAKFQVKDTGEAVDFDYVVACNIKVTRWRDGGLSNDGTLSPRMIAKATRGGQAVMLKTLNACSGFTSENGDVPPDVLPMAIWFDSVEDLSYGLAYVSEEAFDNPLGRLTFEGARVDRATRAEWEAWRRRAADEYVQKGALPGPWGYDYPDNLNPNNPDVGRYVSECQGYTRLAWPEEVKAGVRALWPPEQPRFWTVPVEEGNKISRLLMEPQVASPPGVGPWSNRYGSPSDGALNGFAVCFNRQDAVGLRLAAVDPEWRHKEHVFVVDDEVVRRRGQWSVFSFVPAYVMDRDESVFVQFSIGL